MKLFNKKTTAGLLAGAMLLTGAMSSGIVQAAENDSSTSSEPSTQHQRRHMQRPQINTEKMAQEIEEKIRAITVSKPTGEEGSAVNAEASSETIN